MTYKERIDKVVSDFCWIHFHGNKIHWSFGNREDIQEIMPLAEKAVAMQTKAIREYMESQSITEFIIQEYLKDHGYIP